MRFVIMRSAMTFLLLSCIALCLSNCIIYRTRDLPATAATFNQLKDERKWTMQHGTDSARFIKIESVSIDGIRVTVGDIQRKRDHDRGNKKRYWRGWGVNSKRVAHITVAEGAQIDHNLKLSYKDVKAVKVHRVSGLSFPISLAVVGLFYLAIWSWAGVL